MLENDEAEEASKSEIARGETAELVWKNPDSTQA